MLTINELSCPDELKAPVENIPWESVYRNPFDIRILRAEDGTSAAHEYRAGWFQRNQPYNSRDIDPELRVDFAIIAMGKCGAQELNYISDIDILYVVGAKDGVEEREAVEIGTRLAAMAAQAY